MKLKNRLMTGMTLLTLGSAQAEEIQKYTSSTISDTLKTELVEENVEKKDSTEIKKSPFKITSGYAGSINVAKFDPSVPDKMNHFNTTRVGGGVKYDLTKNLSAHTWGIIDINNDGIFSLGQAFLTQKLGKNYSLSIGNQARPVTSLRPFPVSYVGHFETSTDAIIPGGGNGIRVDKSGKLNGSMGVTLTENGVEYGLNLGLADNEDPKEVQNKINLAGRYENPETFGVVLSGAYRDVSGSIVYNETKVKTAWGFKGAYAYEIPNTDAVFLPYAVQNWDSTNPKEGPKVAELGVLFIGEDTVNGVPIKIVAGPGYTFHDNKIAIYLQLYTQLSK